MAGSENNSLLAALDFTTLSLCAQQAQRAALFPSLASTEPHLILPSVASQYWLWSRQEASEFKHWSLLEARAPLWSCRRSQRIFLYMRANALAWINETHLFRSCLLQLGEFCHQTRTRILTGGMLITCEFLCMQFLSLLSFYLPSTRLIEVSCFFSQEPLMSIKIICMLA